MDPTNGAPWGDRSQSEPLDHEDEIGECEAVVNGGCTSWKDTGGDITLTEISATHFTDPARIKVFHYALFAHSLGDSTTTGLSSCDFGFIIVTLLNDNRAHRQAGTFMHELGHNLNLKNGGDDEADSKPNYLSVMNRMFQTRGLRRDENDGHFDYSWAALDPLDENSLNEIDGIGATGVDISSYGTRYYCGRVCRYFGNECSADADCWLSYQCIGNDRVVDEPEPIDWDCDEGSSEISVRANINLDDDFTTLESSDDWGAILEGGFKCNGNWQRGVSDTPEWQEVGELTADEDAFLTTPFAVSMAGPGDLIVPIGASLAYVFEVHNVGENSDDYALSVSSTLGWAETASLPATVSLDSGESITILLSIQVPAETEEGTEDTLTVKATSGANSLLMDSATVVTTAVLKRMVEIDIKPGSSTNAINQFSRGIIPVVILGTHSFDAAEVDVTTLAFGPDGAAPAHQQGGHFQDVNDDGLTDLLSHYRTQETGIASGDTEACVTGETLDGIPFEGCDNINTQPPCGNGFAAALVLPPLLWIGGRRRRTRA